MELRTFNRRLLGPLRRARLACGPVHETEHATAEVPGRGGRPRTREWDHPHREEIRRVAGEALLSAGLDFLIAGWGIRGETVIVDCVLVLYDDDGEAVEVEEWESSVPLDTRDFASAVHAAQAAVTTVEVHTLRHLLRMPVLAAGARFADDEPAWMKVPPHDPPRPALVKLTCDRRGDVVHEPVDLPEPVAEAAEAATEEVAEESEDAIRSRLLAAVLALGVDFEKVVAGVIEHRRRPLGRADLLKVEAEVARLARLREDMDAAVAEVEVRRG